MCVEYFVTGFRESFFLAALFYRQSCNFETLCELLGKLQIILLFVSFHATCNLFKLLLDPNCTIMMGNQIWKRSTFDFLFQICTRLYHNTKRVKDPEKRRVIKLPPIRTGPEINFEINLSCFHMQNDSLLRFHKMNYYIVKFALLIAFTV